MRWLQEVHRSGRPTAGLSPASGAAVMSTGILSSAAGTAGLHTLAWVLLALAAAAEVVLGVLLVTHLIVDPAGWLAIAATPASLTGVAATAVIGGAVAGLGWTALAWALLAASTALWVVLLPIVLGHWVVPTVGSCFLVCVATEGLAVLAAMLGRLTGNLPVALAGVAAFVLGLGLYAVVVARFAWHELAVGAGDQWVVAGALAITSLAGAELVRAGDRLHMFDGGRHVLAWVDLGFWGLALAGYALLVACEVRWPRWGYDVHRWATVFPMGMTAAASFAVGAAEGIPALGVAGHVLMWPALLAWGVTVIGAVGAWLYRRGLLQ